MVWCALPAKSSQRGRCLGDEAGGRGGLKHFPRALKASLMQSDSVLKALQLRKISRQEISVGRCMFPEEPYGLCLGRSEGCQAGARQSGGGGTGFQVTQGRDNKTGEWSYKQKSCPHPVGKGPIVGLGRR